MSVCHLHRGAAVALRLPTDSILYMLRLLTLVTLAAAGTAIHAPGGSRFTMQRRRAKETELVAAKTQSKPPPFLRPAYAAVGLATTAAWSTVVLTTIASNQPLGALMPSVQHCVFARSR